MQKRTVAEIVAKLESRAPSGTAEAWDNVGLLAGDPAWKTDGAVVSIDLTPDVIATAIKKKYRMIINHHPCIFPAGKGLSRVVADRSTGGLVFEAIRNGIAIASCHTNFDQCALEVVDVVAKGLGVRAGGRLFDKSSGSLLKLVVFIPNTHIDALRAAICEAGAGQIGNYDFCTFGTEGEGTFRGSSDSQPFLGKPGMLENAREIRLETVFPRGLQEPVLAAMRAAHPYEEIAYDLIPVEQRPAPLGIVKGLGYGFWGQFPSPKPFSEVAKSVNRLFNIEGFWLTDPPFRSARLIRKVAFVAGKGASFLNAASAIGCDLMITGEAGYHVALGGARSGMMVLELGHRQSEKFFVPTIKGWLSELGLRSVGLDQATQRFSTGGKK